MKIKVGKIIHTDVTAIVFPSIYASSGFRAYFIGSINSPWGIVLRQLIKKLL